METKLYEIALTLVQDIGDVRIRQLISYCGSAEEVFRAKPNKLTKIHGIGDILAQNLQNKDVLEKAEKIMHQAEKEKVEVLFYTDKNFPNRLKNLYDSPVLLFYKGTADLNPTRSIGIVGTRQASEYGKRMTEEIVEALQSFGVLVMSGLAYGIDIVAHKAAIANNIPTVGVMANGLDMVYPATHQKYVNLMLQNGGILSENVFGTQPQRNLFLNRNRIIAGMSDAVIIVESALKGGAMGTIEYANNYHRDVFAVPGNLKSPYSEGCNTLIQKNKAAIFLSVDNIVETLNWDLGFQISKEKELSLENFTEEETKILALLRQHGETHIDDLSWLSQIPMNRLASVLLSLEFQGFVKALAGKKFRI